MKLSKNKYTGMTHLLILICFFSFLPQANAVTPRDRIEHRRETRAREMNRTIFNPPKINRRQGEPESSSLSKKTDSVSSSPPVTTPKSERNLKMKPQPDGSVELAPDGTSTWYPDGSISLGTGSVVTKTTGQEQPEKKGQENEEVLGKRWS